MSAQPVIGRITFGPKTGTPQPVEKIIYRTAHESEIAFLTELIIDLQKHVLTGKKIDNVDMGRLEQATRILAELERCKEAVRLR